MSNLPYISPLYHVLGLVAEGGTAKVYKGVNLGNGFPVAIKELKTRHLNNPIIKQKFIEFETQLYLYLHTLYPGISVPKLVDLIDLQDRGLLCIVMEFIEGKNLDDYIYREIGLIPEQKALPMFLEILDIVEHLHNLVIPYMNIRNGILHLDIKSGNIMLQPNGKVKLIDLGIASRICGTDKSTGFGTPAYMPPEQSEMGRCGVYTDIFALGVVLFEMLTGQLPFTSQNPSARQYNEEIKHKIKFEPTPQMRQFYPPLGVDLQYIVERALAKNPADRYQSCGEFRSFIKDYLHRNKINY